MSKYASALDFSCAMHLTIFEQPVIKEIFNDLLSTGSPHPRADEATQPMLRHFIVLPIICILLLGMQTACRAQDDFGGLLKQDAKFSLRTDFPPAQGWDADKLAKAMLYAREAGSHAVVVLHRGKLVLEWGDTTARIKSHSVRKSLLSALCGIAVQKKYIDLSETLAELGIDDRPPRLTAEEKQAAVADLLTARSGVYHPAAAESAAMKKARPERGSHAPGEHWYYNNWDFNVLGTIFERATNMPIGRAFKEWIADPVGMQDFRPQDVHYRWETVSLHPSYPFWITARDLARFGQLFLQKGRCKDQQIIPATWIEESTAPHTKTSETEGYGYMWWTHSSGAYFASGYHGQKLVVHPKYKLVIAHNVFTGTPELQNLPDCMRQELNTLINPVTGREFRILVEMILDAGPGEQE